MGYDWRGDVDQDGSSISASRSLLPLLAILAMIAADIAGSQTLRIGALGLAAVLALIIAADLARSFLDPDLNNRFLQGKRTPVTPLQIVFVLLLAAVYSSMILIAMVRLMGMPGRSYSSSIALPVMTGVFLMSCCAAWHNVRLWSGQAAGYADDLRELEEEEQRRSQSAGG